MSNRIHPRYKHDVGYRLSRSGLAIAYDHKIEFQGPIVQNVSYSTGSSTVNITYTAVSSIELRNPIGFEVGSSSILSSRFPSVLGLLPRKSMFKRYPMGSCLSIR